MRLIRVTIACLILLTAAAHAEDCAPYRVLSIKGRPDDSGLMFVRATLGNTPTHLVIDTAGAWSLITEEMAGALRLPRHSLAQAAMQFRDAAGGRLKHYVSIPRLRLGQVALDGSADFVVMRQDGAFSAREFGGTLGLNFLKNFDVEIDGNRGLSLYRAGDCMRRMARANGARALRFVWSNGGTPIARVNVDGEAVDAVIDTGSTHSIMDLDFARRHFGVAPGSPGVKPVGTWTMPSGKVTKSYSYRLKSLAFSGIEFEDVPVELMGIEHGKLILGMNELKHLRLYFAFKTKTIYVAGTQKH